MTVKDLINMLRKEKLDAEIFLRGPYDDVEDEEYPLGQMLRRKKDGDPKKWEIVFTP